MREPASWLPTPSDVRTTSSPMSTALKRALLANTSTRCATSSSPSGSHLGALHPGLDARLDVGLDLGPRHAYQRPVAHARRDTFHRPSVRVARRTAAGAGRDAAAALPGGVSRLQARRRRCQRRILRQSSRRPGTKVRQATRRGLAVRIRPTKGRGPAGNGASNKGFGANPRGGGGLRLPAKGATHHHPQGMLRRREAARTHAKEGLPARYRAGADPVVGLDPRREDGRRPASRAAWVRPPRRPSGRGSPGAGANQEDRRYQHLDAGSGLLGDGKRRRADTRSGVLRNC